MTQEDIQTLVLSATPLYAIVIGIEMIMSYVHNRHYYTAKDTLTNVYLSTLNFLLDVLMKGMVLIVLGGLYEYRWFQIDHVWLYWTMLLLLEDFAFYWEHRIDH